MTAAKQTKTAKTKTAKTKTADTVVMQRDSFDRLAKVMEGMRRMFVTDTHTLKPYAVVERWATMNSTEVAVLLIAKGKTTNNPKFEVGGVFATAELAEQKARDLGIDGKDIVRSWDEITGKRNRMALNTLYTMSKPIPMGKAIVVWVRVEGLVLNAARLLEKASTFDSTGVGGFDGQEGEDARKAALDALFDPMNPKGIPEMWVRLDFKPKTSWTAPTVVLEVLAADPKTYPNQMVKGRADKFVKVAVTRTA